MSDNRNLKRYKNLHSWFKSNNPSSVHGNEPHESANGSDEEIRNAMDDVVNDDLNPSPPIPLEDDERVGMEEEFDINSLERDPGKRRPICKYPLNEQDNIRRAYVVLGPCQPHLNNYPSTWDGGQGRRFCHKWFQEWSWLEYSLEKDRAYCFPCFLFDHYPSRYPSLTEVGFNGWKNGLRDCEKNITYEQHYRANILYAAIDYQLAELESRFTESSMELLVLGSSFDPRANFRAFNPEDVCKLASMFYPLDFSEHDKLALDLECGFFLSDIQSDSRFAETTSVSDLCRRLVEFSKTQYYPMIYRLICLILTLPVSTATTERTFSSMNIIKNKLRNKMNDEFLDDLMVLYIERTFADSIDNDAVIDEFEMSGPRRLKFS